MGSNVASLMMGARYFSCDSEEEIISECLNTSVRFFFERLNLLHTPTGTELGSNRRARQETS